MTKARSTPHGRLRVVDIGDFEQAISLDDKVIPGTAERFVSIASVRKLDAGRHVAIVKLVNGGTALPAQYVVVTLPDCIATERFGTGSDLATVTAKGKRLTITMPDLLTGELATWHFEGALTTDYDPDNRSRLVVLARTVTDYSVRKRVYGTASPTVATVVRQHTGDVQRSIAKRLRPMIGWGIGAALVAGFVWPLIDPDPGQFIVCSAVDEFPFEWVWERSDYTKRLVRESQAAREAPGSLHATPEQIDRGAAYLDSLDPERANRRALKCLIDGSVTYRLQRQP